RPPGRRRTRHLRDPSRPAGRHRADPARARWREALMTAGAAIAWGLRRDRALAMRSRAQSAIVLVLFVLVTSLSPLRLEPAPVLLAKIAPGIAWVAALLASLLGLPRLFAADHADGSLEQLALAPAPLPALVAGKVFAHWVATSLPLVLLAPLAGIQFGLEPAAIGILVATLALGTPVLAW